MKDSERLTYWNNKEKGSALPISIDDAGNTYDLEEVCCKLAKYEDTGLSPEEIEEMRANATNEQLKQRLESAEMLLDGAEKTGYIEAIGQRRQEMNNIEQMKQTVSKAIDDMYQEGGSNIVGYITTALDKKGYRKQSETVKEFAEKLTKRLTKEVEDNPEAAASQYKAGLYFAMDLAEQYGKEEK